MCIEDSQIAPIKRASLSRPFTSAPSLASPDASCTVSWRRLPRASWPAATAEGVVGRNPRDGGDSCLDAASPAGWSVEGKGTNAVEGALSTTSPACKPRGDGGPHAPVAVEPNRARGGRCKRPYVDPAAMLLGTPGVRVHGRDDLTTTHECVTLDSFAFN